MREWKVAGGQQAIEVSEWKPQKLSVAVPVCICTIEESISTIAVREREIEGRESKVVLREQQLEAKDRNFAEFYLPSGRMLISSVMSCKLVLVI